MPRRIATRRRFSSVGIRPARRSPIRPLLSNVQKLKRAATSPARSGKSMPTADSTPLPISYSVAS
jgi:hypothetical protein